MLQVSCAALNKSFRSGGCGTEGLNPQQCATLVVVHTHLQILEGHFFLLGCNYPGCQVEVEDPEDALSALFEGNESREHTAPWLQGKDVFCLSLILR